MNTNRRLSGALCLAGLLSFAVVRAEPLRPTAADRVVASTATVTAQARRAIDDDTSFEGESLATVIDEQAAWRIYHRDHQLLFAIPVRRNLSPREKSEGERRAAETVRIALQQGFEHLFETEQGFQGLDATAVRVVLIEPDAHDPCPGRRSVRSRHAGFGGVADGWNCGDCGATKETSDQLSVDGGFAADIPFGEVGPPRPVPFAAAGLWSAGWATAAACVGCSGCSGCR